MTPGQRVQFAKERSKMQIFLIVVVALVVLYFALRGAMGHYFPNDT